MAVNAKKVFEQAFYTGIYSPDIEKHMDKKAFDFIEKNYLDEKEDIGYRKADAKIIFVLNDVLFNGVVWLKYSFETKSKKDGHRIAGAWGYIIRFDLKQKSNGWQIVNIYDPPY
jgi:hypothetical protein